MENKINEAIDKAIANLNVDNLDVDKEQIDEIKKRLSNDKQFIESLKKQEENVNDESNRRNR